MEDIKPILIYLAGSIRKDKEEFCRAWRKEIRDHFGDEPDLMFVDPIKEKDLDTVYTPEEIYKEDVYAVLNSDIFFVELTQDDYPYTGSMMEIALAHEIGNCEIIGWGPVFRNHYFLKHIFSKEGNKREQYWQNALNLMITKINKLRKEFGNELGNIEYVNNDDYIVKTIKLLLKDELESEDDV